MDHRPRTVARLAHLSDVHFGKIRHPRVVDALVQEVNRAAVDLVVVSGDLTQRATAEQFEAANEFLGRFEAEVLVVPGNHDVRAWWHNPIERIFDSASRFSRYISEDLTPRITRPGLAVFGLNSAHGMTIKGGKIRARHLAAMEAYYSEQPADAFRVLVLHHHLLRLEALGSHDVALNARKALAAIGRSGVNLVLCGHLHTSHVAHVEVAAPSLGNPSGHAVVIASAGTATSSRGRGTDRDVNFFNIITIRSEEFTLEEQRYHDESETFEPVRDHTFERNIVLPVSGAERRDSVV